VTIASCPFCVQFPILFGVRLIFGDERLAISRSNAPNQFLRFENQLLNEGREPDELAKS
jgi:hypothetical protein